MSSLFLDALLCRNKARPPIWLMRQAGRVLPAYRLLREKYSLHTLFHEPELICTVTKLAILELEVDAAILFSDILILFDLFGIDWEISDQRGPLIKTSSLSKQKEAEIVFAPITKAIRSLKSELQVPLIGFAGAPFTLACYLIEGKSPKEFTKTKELMHRDPLSFHRLLNTLTDAIIKLLHLQIEAGVDAIQLFDSLAFALSIEEYDIFIMPYLKRVFDSISKVPTLLFYKKSALHLTKAATLPLSALSLDATIDMAEVRKTIALPMTLQGNLEPELLLAPNSEIERETKALLRSMKNDPAFIVNLGHGLLPHTPLDSIKTLIETVKNASF